MAVPARSSRSTAASVAIALAMLVAPARGDPEPVDVELIIAADVSLSMSYDELQIQREGYIAALTHESVLNAIQDGPHGRIALAMFEWAGDQSQHVLVPWTVIASRADAESVAARLAEIAPNSARRTSISGALDFAGDLFAESGYRGMRRVIDISGDGPNNQGGPVAEARDRLVEQGIVINGLPLITNSDFSTVFDVPDLDQYYTNCVIGGPGAFMIPVNDWDQFPDAVRRKLVLELATPEPPAIHRVGAGVLRISNEVAAYDCMVGEKRWMNRTWSWPSP